MEKGLFDIATIKEYVETMCAFGPRLTGSEAHNLYIDFLEDKLRSFGYEVKEDYYTLNRWKPKNWSLTYQDKGVTVEMPTSYYPYSGCTSAKGVTAPMKWCGKGVFSSFIGSRDKIAVISMPVIEAPCGLVFKKRYTYPHDFVPPTVQSNPVVASFVMAPILPLAKAAGTKGVICIMDDCSDDNGKYQYLPFIKTYAGVPALWITKSQGEQIMEAAKRGEKATLTLDAEVIKNTPTRTIHAVLKGSDEKESILVNTHTDGTNAFEENAGIALLSLAKYFAEKPAEERKKTIVFSFVTGHFQLNQFGDALNQASSAFLDDHKEYWDGKGDNLRAVAGLTLEHLGCTDWADNEDHSEFRKVNDVAPELVYTSNDITARLYYDIIKKRQMTRTLLLSPKNLVHFGEGQPIYKRHIPSISLCPGPDYLCNIAPNGYIDKINYQLFAEQVETFKYIIEVLQNKSRGELGTNDWFNFGFVFEDISLKRLFAKKLED